MAERGAKSRRGKDRGRGRGTQPPPASSQAARTGTAGITSSLRQVDFSDRPAQINPPPSEGGAAEFIPGLDPDTSLHSLPPLQVQTSITTQPTPGDLLMQPESETIHATSLHEQSSSVTTDPHPPKSKLKKDIIERTVTTSSTSIKGSDLYPPPRPKVGEFGNLGREIMLRINVFPLRLPTGQLTQYHVEIFDDVKKKPAKDTAKLSKDESKIVAIEQKRICKIVINNLLKSYKAEFADEQPVYCGDSLYTKKPLWGGSKSREFNLKWKDTEQRPKSHRIKLTQVGTIDLSILEQFINRSEPYPTADERQRLFNEARNAISIIETILGYFPSANYNKIGRNYYFTPDPNYVSIPKLGNGCELWRGFYQCFKVGQGRAFVNMDTSATAMFILGSLMECILDIAGTNYIEDVFSNSKKRKSVCSAISALKIYTNHLSYKRPYRIVKNPVKIFGESSSRHRINLSDGSRVTLENYMASKHNIRLKYPNIPCIHVGNREELLPIELCRVPEGQHKPDVLEGIQAEKMIEYTAVPPYKRMRETEDIAYNELRTTNNPLFDHYGIRIDTSMLKEDGRVLPTPKILYGDNKSLQPRDGSWNLQQTSFVECKQLKVCAIVDFTCYLEYNEIDSYMKDLISVGRNSGINISYPVKILNPNIKNTDEPQIIKEDVQDKLRYLHSQIPNLQLIVVFLHFKANPLPNVEMYRIVKSICDTELGLVSQCVKLVKPRNKHMDPSLNTNKTTLANICMKINAKLGGVNHIVEMSGSTSQLLNDTMILGADVNHSSNNQELYTPSIAAVVCSLDPKISKYASRVRFQKHSKSTVPSKDQPKGAERRKERLEMIDKFEEMSFELLEEYRNFNGKFPSKIIYYRDGVSEGQFVQVLNFELISLRKACSKLIKPCPKISIICVQKRHHIRLYCANEKDEVGKAGNVPPGTIMDRVITHPIEFDFYLCSHFGLQGTSRPTHYHVLYDENNLDANSLQTLTYQLCHSYARCAKSVSIPAPVYHAHHVAFRAHMSIDFTDDASSVSSGSNGDPDDLDRWDEKRKKLMVKSPAMYWA